MPSGNVENGSDGPENPGYDFEKIKADVLGGANKNAEEGSDSVVFNGFYTHHPAHRRYARVIKGDFTEGFDQSKVEYDENLTPEETDDIRTTLYEQFGATPPSDEEFDRQKNPSGDWHDPHLAIVNTQTATEGVTIQELRRWRVLHEDIAAEHGIDPLDFTQWGIKIVKEPGLEPGQSAAKQSLVQDPEKAHAMALAGHKAREDFAGMEPIEDPHQKEMAKRLFEQPYIESIEMWAGILHDHPVSKVYEAAHPELRFTPEGLYNFDRLIKSDEGAIEAVKDEYADYENWIIAEFPRFITDSLMDIPSIPLDELDDVNKANVDPEFAALLRNPDTTLSDLRDYAKKKDIEELQKRVENAKKVLEDVRSGRASEQSSED